MAGIFTEGGRHGWGIASQQDPLGNVVRFMGYVPPSLESKLYEYKRVDFERTWERAA